MGCFKHLGVIRCGTGVWEYDVERILMSWVE
jgi:hypothetical protein